MFSRFGFASFYSPLTLLLRFLPFFIVSFVFSLTILCTTSSYLPPLLFFLSTDSEMFSSFIQSCGRTKGGKKKERVESCFRAMRERLELSGWVWGGCDAVRNHRRCGWRCRPLRPDWCTVSAFPPREPPTATLSGCVSPLTPFPPSLTYTRVYTVNTCAHMQRGPPSCCCGDLLWVVICSFPHYGRSATHE